MIVTVALSSKVRGVVRFLRGERGASGPVTAAIVVPMILVTLMTVLQAGLWYVARTAAMTAAEEGARAMAGQNATRSDGCLQARSFADRAGHNLLVVDSISCTRGATADVVVVGHSMSMVPGMPFKVHQSASLPVEKVS